MATANERLFDLALRHQIDLRRFTVEERVAIRSAAEQNAVLADYLQLMELAQDINTGDADTIAAVTMLEQAGLIAAGRAQEILNGQ